MRATQDEWPTVMGQLMALRARGRRAIRIVDLHCGAGGLLLRAARRARTLGFVAIEGRGIDGDPVRIARAQAQARAASDPAIGLSFEVGDGAEVLREEAEFPPDMVLHA